MILARSAAESKAINQTHGPAVIIASSGMMTGGRIVHHLQQRLPDPQNTIVLGGFQAVGTRGRLIEDGAQFIRMFGHDVPVRAAVEKVPGLSGHADRSDLLRWLDHLPHAAAQDVPHPRRTRRRRRPGRRAPHDRGWDVAAPALGETVELA